MGAIKQDTEFREQDLRQSFDAECKNFADDQLKSICPGCKSHFAGWTEGETPCPYYIPSNIYYDSSLKCFSCKFWE